MSDKLTPRDLAQINDYNEEIAEIVKSIEESRRFKMGDYLILIETHYGSDVPQVKMNSYGVPIKFKVVHVSEQGVAFIKQLNKQGDTCGPIMTCVRDGHWDGNPRASFELDPDYADALLLQDEAYDPTQLHKIKQAAWKEIIRHNKACKVPTNELKHIIKFFKEVEVGTTLWTSNTNYFLVQGKQTMSAKEYNKSAPLAQQTPLRSRELTVLSVVDKNGNAKDIVADYFEYKALYKERPRTLKELKI